MYSPTTLILSYMAFVDKLPILNIHGPSASFTDLIQHPWFTYSCLFYSFFLSACFLQAMRIWPNTFSRPKARAWFFSLLTTTYMIPLALYSMQTRFLKQNFSKLEEPIDQITGGIFVAYFILDIVVGLFWYRSEVKLLSGYVHHVLYLWVIFEFFRYHVGATLFVFGIMEIPTFFMALGNVVPAARTNYIFGLTFFTTRIFYHSLLIPCALKVFQDSHLWIYFVIPFPLHLHWFYGWVKQQRARWQSRVTSSQKSRPHDITPSLQGTSNRYITSKVSKSLPFGDNDKQLPMTVTSDHMRQRNASKSFSKHRPMA